MLDEAVAKRVYRFPARQRFTLRNRNINQPRNVD